MELWSAVANITFTEAASDSAANFKIMRGADSRGAGDRGTGRQPLDR